MTLALARTVPRALALKKNTRSITSRQYRQQNGNHSRAGPEGLAPRPRIRNSSILSEMHWFEKSPPTNKFTTDAHSELQQTSMYCVLQQSPIKTSSKTRPERQTSKAKRSNSSHHTSRCRSTAGPLGGQGTRCSRGRSGAGDSTRSAGQCIATGRDPGWTAACGSTCKCKQVTPVPDFMAILHKHKNQMAKTR